MGKKKHSKFEINTQRREKKNSLSVIHCNQVKMHTRTMQLIHKAVVFPVMKIGTSTLRFWYFVLFQQGRKKNNIFNTAAVFVYFIHAYYHTVSSWFYILTITFVFNAFISQATAKMNTITFKLHIHKRFDYQLMLWASTRRYMLTNFFNLHIHKRWIFVLVLLL